MIERLQIVCCSACGSKNKTKYIFRKYYPYNNSKRLFNKNEIREWIRFYFAALFNGHGLRDTSLFEKLRRRLLAQTLFTSKYRIVKCNDCGYGRYERSMKNEDLYNYYSILYHGLESRVDLNNVDYLSDERALGQFNFVQPILSNMKSKRILEIGAAEAFASRIIHKQFESVCIDVVEPMAEFNEYYQKHNINKVADFFPFNAANIYDYIHTSHWLEHMLDIETTLITLNNMLDRDGLIFVEVPNCTEEYWNEKMMDDHGHIHYFTEKSLTAFFLSSGFELVKIGTFGLTHANLNKYWVSPKLLDKKTLERGSKSITNNILTKDGAYIRALFKKG